MYVLLTSVRTYVRNTPYVRTEDYYLIDSFNTAKKYNNNKIKKTKTKTKGSYQSS